MNAYPLLIEFVSGTRITREPEVMSKLPILQNGPPGTSVVFRDGAEVPLPTDQIVFAEDGDGAAHVGFGGMSFDGVDDYISIGAAPLAPPWTAEFWVKRQDATDQLLFSGAAPIGPALPVAQN